MTNKNKWLYSFIAVAVIAGGIYLTQDSTNNTGLQGQLDLDIASTETDLSTAKPDLTAELRLETPLVRGGDLEANVTIKNIGPGSVTEQTPFSYKIHINDIEVFSNTDTFSSLNAGDSFNFIYPIAKTIYNYPDSGVVTVTIDADNRLEEENETNNTLEMPYTL